MLHLAIIPLVLCRHEYYQKPEEVVVTIFAKGVPAKNVSVDFGEQIVSLHQFCASCLSLVVLYSWFYYVQLFGIYICICMNLTFIGCLQLSVSIDIPGEEAYHFQPRLFGKVWLHLAEKNLVVHINRLHACITWTKPE